MAKNKKTIREDGRYQAQIFLGYDENGKRRYKSVYGQSQTEANNKAQDIKAAMRKGIDVTAERDTFKVWAVRWLKSKALEVSHSQSSGYSSRIDYINTYIGDAAISKIKKIDLQEILDSLVICNPNTGKPASKRLLEITKSVLVQVFDLAIDNRVFEYNPAIKLKIPKNAPAQKRRALTDVEQSWIINTEHRAKTAAMLMLHAGLRRGELIPLTWTDINLNAKIPTITVNKSVERKSNTYYVKDGAKTDAGERIIEVSALLATYLENVPQKGVLVCEKVSGGMHTEISWKRMWDSYLKDINLQHGDFSLFQNKPKSKFAPGGVPFVIPHITPHMLRHTFATLLYFAEVDILSAKEQLGHSDIRMTLGIYTHLDKLHKRKSMTKLNDYLSNSNTYASHMQVSSF